MELWRTEEFNLLGVSVDKDIFVLVETVVGNFLPTDRVQKPRTDELRKQNRTRTWNHCATQGHHNQSKSPLEFHLKYKLGMNLKDHDLMYP